MTTRPAPTDTTTATTYRLRLDNLLLALVLCGLVAAAVPMVYAKVVHRSPARPLPLATTGAQTSAAPTELSGTNLSPAQAVASASALLARGQFASAMKLVENLSGPAADAAGASTMRDRISSAQTTFNADVAVIQTAGANGDWTAVAAAAHDARTLAPLPADAEALARRASAELMQSSALEAARTALAQHRYAVALQLARNGFARWKTADFRELMVASLAGVAASSDARRVTPAATVAATTSATARPAHVSRPARAPHASGGGSSATTSHHTPSNAQHTGAATTQPVTASASTGQASPPAAQTTSDLANDPVFASIDKQLLADALRMLGPTGLAQLQAAGVPLA